MLSMQTPTLGHYILPNLRSIQWRIHSWQFAPFLRLFLNPELVDVHIEFPCNGPHLHRPAIVSLIPTRDLTHLRLGSMEKEDFSLDVLHNLLNEASETLRSVSLGGELSIAVIEKLLQLPNLRCLEVQLPGTRISLPAHTAVLPSLEKLAVIYREAGSWLHVLKNIPNSTLREIDATFLGSSPTHLQTLGNSLLDANLEETLISLKCFSGDGIPLTKAGIRPLLSFRRLTTLNLVSSCTEERCGAQLNDSIISELVMALPQLTSLMLGGIPCEASTSDVTITSLVAISTHCVELDILRLHFDTNDIISRDTHTNSRTHKFTCKLRTLSVGAQPLSSNHDDILLVTFTILHIFPHVETILSTGGDWDQVGRGVRLFRKAPRITPFPAAN